MIIFQIVKITSSIGEDASNLIKEINSLKKEQNSISQVDEFARHSKLERRILKARQELETFNQSVSVSRVQAKAAFVTLWRTIGGLLSVLLMWNYNSTPLHTFAKTSWWQPFGWILSFPTGTPGAVGLPIFTLTLRTVINNCKSGITFPQMPKFEKPREFIHESPQ